MILDALPKKPSASHWTLDEPVTALTAIGTGTSYLSHEFGHGRSFGRIATHYERRARRFEIRL